MTPEQFCYWLKGRAELVNKSPTKEEWKIIKKYLAVVSSNCATGISEEVKYKIPRHNFAIPVQFDRK